MHFPLPLTGKRRFLPMKQTRNQEETAEVKTATAMSFSHGSGLLFFKKDSHSKISFLVDSGATLSISPCTSSATPSGPKMALIFPLGDFKNVPWSLEINHSHMNFCSPKWRLPF
jgi:hypothetical protein